MTFKIEIGLSPELRDIIQSLLAQSSVAAAREAMKEINGLLQGLSDKKEKSGYEDFAAKIRERMRKDAAEAEDRKRKAGWETNEALRSGPSQSTQTFQFGNGNTANTGPLSGEGVTGQKRTQTFADHVNEAMFGNTAPENEADLAKEREDAMQAQFEGQNTPDVNEGTTL